jgi:hypothetical protein
MRAFARGLALAAVVTAMGGAAQAGTIIQATGATANVATRDGASLSSLFDQTGLSVGYTSGVTDFDSYIASGPTHNSVLSPNGWATENNVTAAFVTFDLGSSMTVESMALWNRSTAPFFIQGVKDFELRACPDSTCTSTTLLGSFTALNTVGASDNAVGAQVFAFAATTAQYLRMDMLNTHGSIVLSAGEVAFERFAAVTETPEPASALLLAGGLLALGARRRYRAG